MGDAMDDLRNMNEPRLYQFLAKRDAEFDEWLKRAGLLARKMKCDQCRGEMTLRAPKDGRSYGTWRCGKRLGGTGTGGDHLGGVLGKKCGRERGYLQGTFFEGSHLPLMDIFRLSFYFCRQTHTRELIQFDMEREDGTMPSTHTLADFMEFFREVCFLHYERHPVVIGGPGMVVEIDETVISRRKYNRGRLIREQQWFFGGVERGSNRTFIAPVAPLLSYQSFNASSLRVRPS